MKPKVFISYASRDAEVANAVCKTLEAEDIGCWIAPRDILPGEEYADAIIEALNNCRLFLIILSEESNSSPQVRREVERAVSKDLSILTFRIDNTLLSKAMEYYLSNRHWLDASNAVLSKQLDSLKDAVRNLLEQSPSPKNETELLKSAELQEPVLPASHGPTTPPSPPPPSKPARIHKNTAVIWVLAPALIMIFVAIVYFGLAGKGNIPFFSRQTATITPIPTATMTPVPTATLDSYTIVQAYTATLPTITSDNWIQVFAEPILSQIANRSPDFKDDFSNPDWSNSQWGYFAGAFIENGQLVIPATVQWQGAGITPQASDFVGKFKFSFKKTTSTTLSFGITFRGDPVGATGNDFTFGVEGWCGFGEVGSATRNSIINDCKSGMPDLEQPTIVTIIVQGDRAAAYMNGMPMLYQEGIFHSGNDIALGASMAFGTATVSLDDFELWDLSR